MNFLPAEAADDGLRVAGHRVAAAPAALRGLGPLTLGVRPEYVTLAAVEAEGAVRGTVTRAQDIGTYWLVTAQVGDDAASVVRARLGSHGPVPKAGDAAWLRIVGPRTCFYGADQNLVFEGAAA